MAKGDGIPTEEVLQRLKKQTGGGLGNFSEGEWHHLIALRKGFTKGHADILKRCQFEGAGGCIRVRCKNFGELAKLDKRCPMVKVCLLLFMYLSTAEQHGKVARSQAAPDSSHAENDDDNDDVTFNGRKVTNAKDIKPDVIAEMRTEVRCVCRFETDIRTFLMHYKDADLQASGGDDNRAANALLKARGAFCCKAGKLLMHAMTPFKEAAAKKWGGKNKN